MTKLLEKAIKDTIKKRKPTIGLKQIMHSITSSKLIVISQSVPNEKVKEVETNAKNNNVPTINFEGSSVALGKLCGLQFRVSAISLDSLSNTNTQAIIKENEIK
ncbi:50S ribosomal protein L30e [Marine Group I thaumarchaeote SCGC AAA799-O18]|jgi:large subunit ribosomal protein L30e|nr:50S ribosomal protein L30e [Marine Group I thaumarchaeote SCGC AAA799-O18]